MGDPEILYCDCKIRRSSALTMQAVVEFFSLTPEFVDSKNEFKPEITKIQHTLRFVRRQIPNKQRLDMPNNTLSHAIDTKRAKKS